MSGDLHCIARRRGIIVGLLDGLELLLFKLLLLSRLGDACTVILCWKSVREQNKPVLMFWIKNISKEHAALLLKTKLYNELHLIICNLFIHVIWILSQTHRISHLHVIARTWTTASSSKWTWSETHPHHRLLFNLFGCHRRGKKISLSVSSQMNQYSWQSDLPYFFNM